AGAGAAGKLFAAGSPAGGSRTDGSGLWSVSGDMESGLRTDSCPITESSAPGHSTRGARAEKGIQHHAGRCIAEIIRAAFAHCQQNGQAQKIPARHSFWARRVPTTSGTSA